MSEGWVPETRPTDEMSAAERRRLVDSMRPEDAAPVPQLSEVDVPDELRERIESAMQKYPEIRSASLPALWAVQRHYGWCTPEGIRQAAAVMGVTPGYLESVATFYDLFHTSPVGKHRVLVCHNLACWLRGAEDVRTTSAPAPRTASCTCGASSAWVRAISRRWRRSTSATTGR